MNVSNEPGPQSETDIAIDPTEPTHLIGGANSITSDGAMRVFESFDGGGTWTHARLPRAPHPYDAGSSDPAVTFDTQGNAYYSFLGLTGAQDTTLVCTRKAKAASAWGRPAVIPNTGADKNLMTADRTGGSFSGAVYIAWDDNRPNGQAIMLARSSNGTTFQTTRVNGQGTNVIGAAPAVGPNGEVYVAWANYAASQHNLFARRSDDGGKTFSGPDCLIHHWAAPTGRGLDVKIPADPERGVPIFPSIDVDRSTGPRRGTVYVVYNDVAPGAGLNVYLRRSTDRGQTWSAPVRVNDDVIGKNDHFLPRVAVDDADGSVHVVWYDTRLDPTRRKTNLFYSRSTDGGLSFEKNTRVTSAPSDESGHGASATPARATSRRAAHARATDDELADANGYGDYIGLAVTRGVAHPLWCDSRAGTTAEEVFTATVTHSAG